MAVRITIDGLIHIDGLEPHVARPIKKGLSIENPLYARLKRMGNIKALYAVQPYFHYFSEDKRTGRLSVGRGVEKRVQDFLKKSGIRYTVDDHRCRAPMENHYDQAIQLREYQVGVPEEIMKNEYGIIKCGTGFGKTPIAIEVARRLGLKALFIVPRTQLFEQFDQTLRDHLHCEPGRIKGTECTLGDYTVATIQTLQKNPDLVQVLAERTGACFVDECHGFQTRARRHILAQLKPQYLYGLTATPRRTDKQDEAIGFTFGPILVDRELPQEKPTVEVIRYHRPFAHFDYHEIAASLAEDTRRSEVIAGLVSKEVNAGRRILVLTKRIKHYRAIYKIFDWKERDGMLMLQSAVAAKKNRDQFEGLRTGAIPFACLLGTFSYLSVGIDIPSIDTVLLAGDLRSDVLAEQAIGRCKRLFVGKKSPKVIDIWDTGCGILKSQGATRQKFYEKMGWKIYVP